MCFGYLMTMALPLMASGRALAMSGSGTADDPYQIDDCNALQQMDNDLTAYYQLSNDIDCSASSGWNAGAGFSPIGPGNFTGTLDGQGFSIDGLTINRGSSDNLGLFASLQGTVENLRLTNETVSGHYYIGGLAGSTDGGTISKVKVDGNVSGMTSVGGLVGEPYLGSISQAGFSGTVTASTQYAGGLIGADDSTPISNSYANATVTSGLLAGGLAAWLWVPSGSLAVNDSYSAGSVSGGTAGGLFAETQGPGTISINNSFSAANPNGGAGIIAETSSGSPSLSNVEMDMLVTGNYNCVDGDSYDDCWYVNDDSPGQYFQDSSTNYPLSLWDWSSVWQVTDIYPTLQGLDVPQGASAPGEPTAIVNNPTSPHAGISWSAPASDGGSPVQDYEVQYMVQGDSSWTTLGYTTGNDDEGNFDSGTIVRFRVAAINLAGQGAYATGDYFTVGVFPPQEPTDLQAVSDAADAQMDLSWTAPSDTGTDAITNYLVEYQDESGGGWSAPINTGSSATSYDLSGLNSGDTYDFRVAAQSDAGTSSYTELDGSAYSAQVYNITNCAQLQDIQNDLSGDYTLENNIDCSDTYNWNDDAGFIPIGDIGNPFTGMLNGNGYTISDLYIADPDDTGVGLFGVMGGLVGGFTLKDADVSGTDQVGGVAGIVDFGGIEGVTVQNIEISDAGNDQGAFYGIAAVGGLVGSIIDGGGLIGDSSTGQVFGQYVGGNYVSAGGLVGLLSNGATIQDAYSSASLFGSDGPVASGGLVGSTYDLEGSPSDIEIDDSYANASFRLGVYNVSGGLVGLAGDIEIDDSFSASDAPFTSGGSVSGGLIGYSDGTVLNDDFYDFDNSGGLDCTTNGSADGCTAVNTADDPDPGYFLDNSTNGPLGDWGFGFGWNAGANSYPTLVSNLLGNLTMSDPSSTDSTVTLNWTPPTGDQTPTRYEVRYHASGDYGDWTYAPQPSASATSATLSGLSAGTGYEIQLRYSNAYGRSGWIDVTAATSTASDSGGGSGNSGSQDNGSGSDQTQASKTKVVTELVHNAATAAINPLVVKTHNHTSSKHHHNGSKQKVQLSAAAPPTVSGHAVAYFIAGSVITIILVSFIGGLKPYRHQG